MCVRPVVWRGGGLLLHRLFWQINKHFLYICICVFFLQQLNSLKKCKRISLLGRKFAYIYSFINLSEVMVIPRVYSICNYI